MSEGIRLNCQTLFQNKKGYAELIFIGDIHYGHPQTDMDRLKGMIKYCIDKGVYVILMGDLMECGLRMSVGDSVYSQLFTPQKQMEDMIDLFYPLAKKKLIIGLHRGNHEERILVQGGFDPSKIMAKELGVKYLDYACWSLLKVGSSNYSMYSWHGRSGSRFLHTKLKAAIDTSNYFEADIVAMAHVHELATDTVLRQRVNLRNHTVDEKKCHILLTGSYLSYDKSYAQNFGYPPAKLGSPKIKLFGNKWDIHSSL
jgi:hypothetical protein